MRRSTAARSCARGRCAARSTSIPARDLAWVLSHHGRAAASRQAAAVHRREGIDDDELARAERARPRGARGRQPAHPQELFARARGAAASSTAGQRGYHLLVALSLRAVLCQGPVVPREGARRASSTSCCSRSGCRMPRRPPTRSRSSSSASSRSHGPAGARDFAWWSGPAARGRRARRPSGQPIASPSSRTSPSRTYVAAGARAAPVAAAPDGHRAAAVRGVLPLVRRSHGAVRAGVPRRRSGRA